MRSARGAPMSATGASLALAESLGGALSTRGIKLVTAESCTGGLIAAAVTDVAGSSAWFDRGFVTYSNEAKIEMLGVRSETLLSSGAVSEPVAREMAAGALARSAADLAVAVTGVAGPAGGSAEKPVGMVCFAWARRDGDVVSATHQFPGDRAEVRAATVAAALARLLELAAGGCRTCGDGDGRRRLRPGGRAACGAGKRVRRHGLGSGSAGPGGNTARMEFIHPD